MHIAFERPEHTLVDFDNILNIFKEKNCNVDLIFNLKAHVSCCILRNAPMPNN